jgi:hypothetical protein
MSTATLHPPTAVPSRPAQAPFSSPAAGDSSALCVFLLRYTGTLLPLAVALAAFQCGGQLLTNSVEILGWSWPVAAAVGWALTVAVWLHRRSWARGMLVSVGAGPAAALAIPAAVGWVSPAGLLLWGPVSTVLAVALALAAQPQAPADPPPRRTGPPRLNTVAPNHQLPESR